MVFCVGVVRSSRRIVGLPWPGWGSFIPYLIRRLGYDLIRRLEVKLTNNDRARGSRHIATPVNQNHIQTA